MYERLNACRVGGLRVIQHLLEAHTQMNCFSTIVMKSGPNQRTK
jgi:hypothetical protein